MSDYISRQAAQMQFACEGSVFTYGRDVCKAIVGRLDMVPAADVRENVKGRWEYSHADCYKCSECGHVIKADSWSREALERSLYENNAFCGHCGADMRGEANE